MRLAGGRLATPVGELRALVDESGAVVRITFWDAGGDQRVSRELEELGAKVEWESRAVTGVLDQLAQYFAGERKTFDLELRPRGSEFQLRVWSELARIPFGKTISYGELARRLGDPGASRAVGQANNKNPLPVVLPCHRVIGGDRSLTGFGGGLTAKRWLLDFESGQRSFVD